MSDSDRDDVIVSTDEITVRKSLDTEQYKSPLITFNIQSTHNEPIRFQLIDEIPAAVSTENIGFHPDYGAEYWIIGDNSIVFERTVDPDEEYTTIYGIRDMDGEIHKKFLTEPEINFIAVSEMGNEAEELDDVLSREKSESVKDVISGERNTLPGLEKDVQAKDTADEISAMAHTETTSSGTSDGVAEGSEETDPMKGTTKSGADAETERDLTNLDETDEPAVVASNDAATETDTVDSEDEMDTPPRSDGNVARALAKDLREGNVSEEDRQLLCNELVISENSTEVRIQRLQNQMSDFAAYIDALEEFIDEEGTGQELLDELTDAMNGLDDRMGVYQDEIAGIHEDVDDLRDAVRDINEDMDGMQERVNGIETVQEHLDDLESELAAVRDEVDEVAQFRERLKTTFGSLTGGVEPDESDEGV